MTLPAFIDLSAEARVRRGARSCASVAAIVLLFGASLAQAQINPFETAQSAIARNPPPPPQPQALQDAYRSPPATPPTRPPDFYTCWAEVPSRNTTYFSAMFEAGQGSRTSRIFGKRVTTEYGRIAELKCIGKPSMVELEQLVQLRKEAANAKGAMVETGWSL